MPKLIPASPLPAHPPLIREGTITLAEFVRRRERVLTELKGSSAVIFAGDQSAHLSGKWRPDLHFLYLTGIETEPGAAVLFDPSHPSPKRRIVLFLRPLNPESDRWEGYRDEISTELRASTGFATVMRTTMLPAAIAGAARRTKRLSCLHPLSTHTADVGPDLAIFRKVCERTPGTAIEDRSMLLPAHRACKSVQELVLMKRAAAATTAGYRAVLAMLRPGTGEQHVQRTIETAYIGAGAEGTAYSSIVGCGINATILHYDANSGACRAGELLLIDSGAKFAGYACDVTRTFPVDGRFTPEQRAIYEVVLKAQLAAMRAARPGKFMWEVDTAARDVIEAAGYGDHFPHGTGHQLGLHVHDADPETKLEPGMVITIEPGIYIAAKNLGIRIEDDLLITRTGNTNLTAAIPKTVAEIERAMSKRA